MDARHWEGAYYLAGYSVECALKACIAKQVKQHDFPDLNTVNRSYTHDLEKLIGLAGLKERLKNDFNEIDGLEVNWSIVKDWSEAARYSPTVAETLARDMYNACSERTNGVLTWLRQSW